MDEDSRRAILEIVNEAQHRLRWAADLLRGPEVPACEDAMHLEMAVTRAIDALSPILRKA